MITREELKELLFVFQYYILAGLAMGVVAAAVSVNGGVVLTRMDLGTFLSPRIISGLIVLLIGVTVGVLAYLALLPAELRLVRRKLRPKILRRKLMGQHRRFR